MFCTQLVVKRHLMKWCFFIQSFLGTTWAVLLCLNVSVGQRSGVTVINPLPPQACHLHNKATIADANVSPHFYCYNYLTFRSTLMSPGWSHSLSSFGFQALLLSNKVTFHNTSSPWNTHPPHKYTSTCICSAPNPEEGAGRNYKKIKLWVGSVEKRQFCMFSELTPSESQSRKVLKRNRHEKL